jgi:ribosome-associated protein YbcJ (S4-like RNA binding protein)
MVRYKEFAEHHIKLFHIQKNIFSGSSNKKKLGEKRIVSNDFKRKRKKKKINSMLLLPS